LELNCRLGFEKAKYLKDICKAQITVFPEATVFANAEAE
jgi:hypothetical protein